MHTMICFRGTGQIYVNRIVIIIYVRFHFQSKFIMFLEIYIFSFALFHCFGVALSQMLGLSTMLRPS